MTKDLKLVLVNVFHRHGERSPLNVYDKPLDRITACTKSNDYLETLPRTKRSFLSSFFNVERNSPLNFELLYKNNTDGECAPGQLTDHGKRTLYNFGKNLRKDYVDSGFIKDHFDKNEVNLTSTDFQRTIESLQSLIKGLFKYSSDPIQINIGKRGIKSLYTSKFCERYVEERNHHKKIVHSKHEGKIKKIRDYISKNYPVLNKVESTYGIFDIVASSLGNKSSFFKNFSPKILRLAEDFSLDLFFGHLEKRQNLAVARGEIIRDLHDRIFNVVNDSLAKTKMFILSGHDVTLYPLLMAFNIHDKRWPVFGSNLVYETYKSSNNKFYIKVKYNGKVKEIPLCTRTYNGDKSLCLVDDFLNICKQYIPKDRDELCVLK